MNAKEVFDICLAIHKLETKADECLHQAADLRTKLEVALNPRPIATKSKGTNYPNGPQQKLLRILEENKNKDFSKRDISDMLGIKPRHTDTLIRRMLKRHLIFQPTALTYMYNKD